PCELIDVAVQNRVERLVESRGADGVDDELAEDLRIRLPGEIVAVGRALPVEHGGQRGENRLPRGAAGRDERAVHVEENETAVPSGARDHLILEMSGRLRHRVRSYENRFACHSAIGTRA